MWPSSLPRNGIEQGPGGFGIKRRESNVARGEPRRDLGRSSAPVAHDACGKPPEGDEGEKRDEPRGRVRRRRGHAAIRANSTVPASFRTHVWRKERAVVQTGTIHELRRARRRLLDDRRERGSERRVAAPVSQVRMAGAVRRTVAVVRVRGA